MLSRSASAPVATGRTRVLIADDEPLARRRLRVLIDRHPDFEIVAECVDGLDAMAKLQSSMPDVAFIDVQMPGSDGVTVARSITGAHSPVIVFVTAFEEYAIEAFGVRAVDYVLKPFDEERFAETLSRVRERLHMARLQAQSAPDRAQILTIGKLEIDLGARRVRFDGKVVLLRRKEFDVLVRLATKSGNVLSRRELLDDVWGYKADVVSRTLDTHVCELRRKLDVKANEPSFIETIARVGYRMVSSVER